MDAKRVVMTYEELLEESDKWDPGCDFWVYMDLKVDGRGYRYVGLEDLIGHAAHDMTSRQMYEMVEKLGPIEHVYFPTIDIKVFWEDIIF